MKKLVNKAKKLAIVGSRSYTDNVAFTHRVIKWCQKHGNPIQIISGGAPGVDTMAKNFAMEYGIVFTEFHANWETHKKSAGPMRNTLIAKTCTHLLAFAKPTSTGTYDTIKKAQRAGKHITICPVT